MKRFFLVAIMLVMIASLIACGNQKVEEVVPNHTTTVEPSVKDISESKSLSNEAMYGSLLQDYRNAIAEYDLEDVESDAKIGEKYPLVNLSLLMHIAHYSATGAKPTYTFYDIDENGVNELIVGVNDSFGAIYSYDKSLNQPVKIYFQETLERGSLFVFDNGIILSEGAGGAALHYYEYGKIASETASYEMLESIEEEYVEGSETPVYRDNSTGDSLEYQSLDEIDAKYLSDAKMVEIINMTEF